MTNQQEYQIPECLREMRHRATPDELIAKGYAATAVGGAMTRRAGE